MLKLIPVREGHASIRIRGTHLGVYIDKATKTADFLLAQRMLVEVTRRIEAGERPWPEDGTPLQKYSSSRPEFDRRTEMVLKERYVYCFQSRDIIKIGITDNVDRRIGSSIVDNPFVVEVCRRKVRAFLALAIEAKAHAHLAPHHLRGEWFTATPEQGKEAIAIGIASCGPPEIAADYLTKDDTEILGRLAALLEQPRPA